MKSKPYSLKKILIVYNPKSGRFSEKRLSFIISFLKNKGIESKTLNMITDDIDKKFASCFDAIFVAAGDGSLNHVINHFAFTEIPIAHLPMGTVNLFALENKTPRSLKGALNEILNKYEPVKVNLGKANGRYFLAMTGIGLDAFIVKNIEEKIRINKKRMYNNTIKYLNYIFNIIKISGNYKFPDIHLNVKIIKNSTDKTLDGHELFREYYGVKQIIVSNIMHYGGPFKIFPKNSPLSDKFDIRLISDVSGTIDVIFSILKSLCFHRIHADDADFYLKTDIISVSASKPEQNKNIFYQCDGEFAGTLPVEIEKVSNAATMLANPSLIF
ncbi:diacylglycerol/lipid kinase family protein [Candidatus Acidulodesulfobacterium sp. H_13]|uniref:diacylglycerol/lipid kinase family protein n=1 Tax=Candidatus Acidulodesulfobacterium sp. H_13 TaxID=3395470 RepID=UPI003AF8085A